MKFKSILFDINGTLVDILTDEGRDDIYRTISNFMRYQGIFISADNLRKDYFARLQQQKKASGEEFPEFDAVQLWFDFLTDQTVDMGLKKPGAQKFRYMSRFLAEMYRAASMFKLQLYPGVEETLTALAKGYRLAALSDAQSAWAVPELRVVQLENFFETIVVSGDLGYRKPDQRIFSLALKRLKLLPQEVLFVGNDMYRDVYGAQQAGLQTVYFATNQGRSKHKETEPDYIIYNFNELPTAVAFLESKAD